MRRSDLIEDLCTRAGVPRDKATRIVACFFDTIAAQLAAGGRVELRGFGSFSTRRCGAGMRRDPRNGDRVAVAPRRAIFFRAGRRIRLWGLSAGSRASAYR